MRRPRLRFELARAAGPVLVIYATSDTAALKRARSEGHDVLAAVEAPLYEPGTFGPEAAARNRAK